MKENKLEFIRLWTRPEGEKHDPLLSTEWEERDVKLTNEEGQVIFEQESVTVPKFWSQLATNIVASKYFSGHLGAPNREYHIAQLASRVSSQITSWGLEDGYFDEANAQIFEDELNFIIINQIGAFNTPVWLNAGLSDRPQTSACFINSVKDDMDSIMRLAHTEATIFKNGSGSGTNFSTLRGRGEKLSGGGKASGPVSFMKGFDAFAGIIKSGGRLRRAAKMVILNVDHPDILRFIDCKASEEKKAHALINAGYSSSIEHGAYASVFFQNSNNSVRVTNEFMKAVEANEKYEIREVSTGNTITSLSAREVLKKVAKAAHQCGDPGLQFDTTINKWNTCLNTDRLNASNPCGEYHGVDDSACNLASINLLKFLDEKDEFLTAKFCHTVSIFITAQDIIIDRSSYPNEKIERNAKEFRALGLGYANLGALLMSCGLPYDCEEARTTAGAITALMTGAAYEQSAKLAQCKGAFTKFEKNKSSMWNVIQQHKRALNTLDESWLKYKTVVKHWGELRPDTEYRNSQVTLLAPTGTIAFMMDCDTTGIEPEVALVRYKQMVGGGTIKLASKIIPKALKSLGYDENQIRSINGYALKYGHVVNAPDLKKEHYIIFDCSLSAGNRQIGPQGHLKMMETVQPFLSGAISKTVSVPETTTIKDIENIFLDSWKMGLKAVSIYREGSKKAQPLITEENKKNKIETRIPFRNRLPNERKSVTHAFSIAGHKGYITAGMYPNGDLGEVFIHMAKAGSVVSGLMDSFAVSLSLSLQYGVPLEILINKHSHTRFEPSGFTTNPEIPIAKSIVDYIFRWLELKFPKIDNIDNKELQDSKIVFCEDAPVCVYCGSLMRRNGSCYICVNCGETSGCS